MKLWRCLAIATWLAACLPAAAAPPEVGLHFKVDGRFGLPPSLVTELAVRFPPIAIQIAPKERLREALSRHCVAITEDYVELARDLIWALNDQVPAQSASSIDLLAHGFPTAEPFLDLRVPFCPNLRFEGLVIKEGDTLLSLYRRSQLVSTPGDIDEDWKWRFLAANKHVSERALQAYAELAGPAPVPSAGHKAAGLGSGIDAILAAMRGRVVQVPVGIASDIEVFGAVEPDEVDEVRAIIAKHAPRPISQIRTLTGGEWGELVADHDGGHAADHDGGHAADPCGQLWLERSTILPVQADDVLRVLAINERVRDAFQKKGGGTLRTISPTILVADTGLLELAFPPFRDIVGDGRLSRADRRYRAYRHGTHVASIAIGGPSFALRRPPIGNPILLEVKNIFDGDFILRKRVDETVADVNSRGSDVIVNLSIWFPPPATRPDPFFYLALNQRRGLYVVAVGNHPEKGWPAMYGGPENLNIIVVAALTPSGRILPDSYESRADVDIGALGWCVPTLDLVESINPNDTEFKAIKATGTSMAAPQVSFVAALIKREANDLNAVQIKRRILFAADLHAQLESSIKHGRVLNPEKALSIFLDVLKPKKGSLLFGAVALPSDGAEQHRRRMVDMINLCGDRERVTKIRRITRKRGEAEKAKLLIYVEDDDVTEIAKEFAAPKQCDALPGNVRFKDLDGNDHTFSFDEIDDIVMALPERQHVRDRVVLGRGFGPPR